MGLMCTPESGSVVDCYNLSVDYEEKGDLQKALGGTANLLCALKLYEKSRRLCKALSGALGTIAEDGGEEPRNRSLRNKEP